MQVLSYDDDFLPRVSFESQQDQHHQNRRRGHRRASSCCGFPISPSLPVEGLSRRNFSYDKLPQHPLNLTIRKLDGSFFQVEVAKGATVAELKQAVEGVFINMPREGPGQISWAHVWGHFCLCYDGWKLLNDSESISYYAINDGDQLHFVRHVSVNYNLVRKRSKDRLSALEQPSTSDGISERDDSSDDQENSKHHQYDDGDETRVFGRWSSYQRLGSPGKRFGSNSFSSRFANGCFGSFRSILRLWSGNKLNSLKDPLDEV